MYLDRLMEQGKALDWGICGVGVMPFDLKMKEVMDSPGLPVHPGAEGSLTAAGSRGSSARSSSTCTRRTIPEAVIEKMADPATRIVSLTVTEGGYNFHPVTGEFDADNPAVQADLAPGAVAGAPRSA